MEWHRAIDHDARRQAAEAAAAREARIAAERATAEEALTQTDPANETTQES